MKQLRYLIDVTVCQMTRNVNEIGETYESADELLSYPCYVTDNTNAINDNNYGATIRNRKRISSVRNELEEFLINIVDYTSENVSYYRLKIGTKMFKIIDVKQTYVDAELI